MCHWDLSGRIPSSQELILTEGRERESFQLPNDRLRELGWPINE